jgi:flagellar hook-basal body complex protein FliE
MAIPAFATSSYAAAQKLLDTPLASSSPSGSFSDLVKQSIGSLEAQAKVSDQTMMNAAAGHVDYVQAVTTVSDTEAAVETLVAVRDKVISAYDDIMRMTI